MQLRGTCMHTYCEQVAPHLPYLNVHVRLRIVFRRVVCDKTTRVPPRAFLLRQISRSVSSLSIFMKEQVSPASSNIRLAHRDHGPSRPCPTIVMAALLRVFYRPIIGEHRRGHGVLRTPPRADRIAQIMKSRESNARSGEDELRQ